LSQLLQDHTGLPPTASAADANAGAGASGSKTDTNVEVAHSSASPEPLSDAGQSDSVEDNDALGNADSIRPFRNADLNGRIPQPHAVSQPGAGTSVPLTPYSKSILDRYDKAPVEPQDSALRSEIQKARPSIAAILGKYPDITKAPPQARAALYALTQLGDTDYGLMGTVNDPVYTTAGKAAWKCNIFAAKSYTRGAGIGYRSASNPSGYQVNTTSIRGDKWPPAAADMNNPRHSIPNFPVVGAPQLGDIVAFGGGHLHGHVGVSLGGNLIVYAGQNDVKLGTIPYVQKSDGFTAPVTYRRYMPGK
jgi:hypothetical protein